MSVDRLVAAVRSDLGDPDTWVHPKGYPDSMALAVIDSIQSLGVTYTSVVNVIGRYRAHRTAAGGDADTDTPADLVASFDALGGAEEWARQVGNQNRTSTSSGAPLKAVVIEKAARLLIDHGILTGPQFLAVSAGDDDTVKRLWHALEGQRPGTSWSYLHILLGAEDVKPDRMIIGYVSRHQESTDHPMTPARASAAVRGAASQLGVSERLLEHNIWRFEGALRTTERSASRR